MKSVRFIAALLFALATVYATSVFAEQDRSAKDKFGVDNQNGQGDSADGPAHTDKGDGVGKRHRGKYRKKGARPGFPKLKGPRKTIAVKRFRSADNFDAIRSLADDYDHEGRTTFVAQLVQALKDTKHFIVVDRLDLDDVLDEQDLAGSGRAARTRTARKGKIIPAQYIVRATITEFEIETERKGGNVFLRYFDIGGEKIRSHLAVVIEIIDTTTGEVIISKTVEGRSDEKLTDIGLNVYGFGFDAETKKKDPYQKSVRIAVIRAVKLIVETLEEQPWRGKIVKVKGDGAIVIKGGKREAVELGYTFSVSREGDVIIDEDTGEVLDKEVTEIGAIKVTKVKEKVSYCEPISGKEFRKGDIVKWLQAGKLTK